MAAYGEFELDIPNVMRGQLPQFFASLADAPLTLENIALVPESVQGAYLLFLGDRLVYVGKTDAQAGFRNRLTRHFYNIQHRRNLDPLSVSFKAARIFVFSTFDLETMLIEEYTRSTGLRPVWNFSGFGSNDPGRNREDQKSAQFDLEYPVDIERIVDVLAPGQYNLIAAILSLKRSLPYIFRYETDGANARSWQAGHSQMLERTITVPPGAMTTRAIMQLILNALPDEWQATVLPNRIILYREHKTYPAQVEVLRRF
ncbi:GIY-YIG nuclease family protein [Pararhizobium sp.]|uniref:GIY-YIG nuclease family protein n=1 Tax=Pararhizobium sp. TaxID=1977563 RepID=UPI00271C7D06|nr:GIY-YIG nuclease family protein [Pararhizobium sp.]MDO9417240.1 Eco29kI family restriction endonuclease [Pararhizobium sp.]